jgi:VWFA-related protein
MRHAGLLCLAAVAAPSWAQQSPVIRTETRVVLVDAVVTAKNGAYVRDLTAKDFRVWEDNKEQSVGSVTLESHQAASTVSRPEALVLFFDEIGMEARDQIAARQAASGFIDAQTGPNRRMAVVSYNGALRIAQNFTDNAGRLKDALPKPAASPGERPDYVPVGVRQNPTDDSAGRNLMPSLRNLGASLGVLPGRKIVVLFTGRLSSSATQRSDMREAIEACNKSGVAVYPVDVRNMFAQTDLSRTDRIDPYYGNRDDRPHGGGDDSVAVGQDSGGAGQQILFGLAGGTGGFVIRNSNDLLGGLQKVAAEQNEYYVLSYTPPESKEGSCHTLRVKVDRSAATVRARTGYCTLKPQDLLAGTIAGQDLEKRAASAAPGNMAASIALPYFYVSPNVARVHLAMEITPGALKFENQKGKLHAEINLLGIATTADGGVRARFSDTLNFDVGNATRPVHYEKEFRIAPGQYTFTMAFGQPGESDASFGKVEAPLAVEPRTEGELALSGLVLSRETHPAADLGLISLLGPGMERRTPLIADGTQIVPSGSNQFTKSEPGFVYFEVYAPDPASVRYGMRVLDPKTGEPKSDSGFRKLDLPKGGGDAVPVGSSLPVGGLAPGSYDLEVTAVDSAGKQVRRTANFEVK